jgi:RNA polymerase sigma-70 factor (ECF subfamily)
MAKLAIAYLRRGHHHEELDTHQESASLSSPPADSWSALDLERAIATLSDAERSVFVLRQMEGYSHAEIASLLGITPGAARVRYVRALKNLRNSLEPSS